MVELPPDESVRHMIAEKMGRLWRRLASGLGVKDAILDAIEEEKERQGQECCQEALRRWHDSKGSGATTRGATAEGDTTRGATTREIMICLTNMGYANVNWHIMRDLSLVARENMPQSERT